MGVINFLDLGKDVGTPDVDELGDGTILVVQPVIQAFLDLGHPEVHHFEETTKLVSRKGKFLIL